MRVPVFRPGLRGCRGRHSLGKMGAISSETNKVIRTEHEVPRPSCVSGRCGWSPRNPARVSVEAGLRLNLRRTSSASKQRRRCSTGPGERTPMPARTRCDELRFRTSRCRKFVFTQRFCHLRGSSQTGRQSRLPVTARPSRRTIRRHVESINELGAHPPIHDAEAVLPCHSRTARTCSGGCPTHGAALIVLACVAFDARGPFSAARMSNLKSCAPSTSRTEQITCTLGSAHLPYRYRMPAMRGEPEPYWFRRHLRGAPGEATP